MFKIGQRVYNLARKKEFIINQIDLCSKEYKYGFYDNDYQRYFWFNDKGCISHFPNMQLICDVDDKEAKLSIKEFIKNNYVPSFDKNDACQYYFYYSKLLDDNHWVLGTHRDMERYMLYIKPKYIGRLGYRAILKRLECLLNYTDITIDEYIKILNELNWF